LPYLIFLALLSFGIVCWWSLLLDEGVQQSYARCDNCHCVAADGICPVERTPFLDYSVDTTNLLEFQKPLNPFNLTCNPFTTSPCRTSPTQSYTDDNNETAVCGIRYLYSSSNNNSNNNTETAACPTTYTLKTYTSVQTAYFDDVSTITHIGACGVCSTTQDLAALIRIPDMVTASKMCIKKGGIIHDTNSYACFRNMGFSPPCAFLWHEFTRATMRDCFNECVLTDLGNKAYNDPDDCNLNKCLQCQNDKTEAIFERVGGRTHARSGLLSSVVKPCHRVPLMEHDACPPLFSE
jgi:hypothetical protein